MSPIVTRSFLQVAPVLGGGLAQPIGGIEEFFGHHVLVVLGEPGLGKTTSFRHAAAEEPGATFVRIGEFLSAPRLDSYSHRILYLDGLDEHRSRALDMDVMDALIGRLRSLGSPKVRISCRTAEWHGGKDLDALSAVGNGTSIVQLELQPLTPEDISRLVSDLDSAFVDGAKSHGLDQFLTNPQDLELLREFYLERNRWPDSRTELMEGACKALLKELNKEHAEQIDDLISDRNLTRASDYLACILLLSNVAGIARDRRRANKMFPAIHEFHGDLTAMKAATGRRVFKAADEGRIEPKHRTIAEYMAARFLAAAVRGGLSLRRVMALMTGIDGGTAPDLRGVYAWLVSMLSGMAEHVLVHDPYGALIYGDPQMWTPNTRRSALAALRNLASRDPWFRAHDRSRSALGGLSDKSLVEDFKEILESDNCESHLVGTILDAVAGGPVLSELGDSLLGFLRNANKPDHLREQSIRAFVQTCPNRSADLMAVLDEINRGELRDDHHYLRGGILDALYPTGIRPDQVADYLVAPSRGGVIGRYHVFLRRDIFERTDNTGLRALARRINEINQSLKKEKEGDFWASAFVSGLVQQLVSRLGHSAQLDELYSWISIGLNEYGSSQLDRTEAETVREFFTKNDDLYIRLFLHTLHELWPTEQRWHVIWRRFLASVSHAQPPNEFPRALLAEVRRDPYNEKSRALFELACRLAMNQDPTLSSVSIDDLRSVSLTDPPLTDILERNSRCDIEEWRQENAARAREQLEERQSRLAKNIQNLTPHKTAIETGKATAILDHFALVWFGLFTDVDHDVDPRTRLGKEVGEELAEAVVAGLVNALHQRSFDSLEEIAQASQNNKAFHRGFVMLAGMDLVAARGIDAILDLPDDVLELAVAYEMSNAVDRQAEWLTWVLQEREALVASALDSYWRAQLKSNSERLTRFYQFGNDDPWLPAIVRILPALLRDFPTPSVPLLESMLSNAVLYCPRATVLNLVDSVLPELSEKPDHDTLWTATGFALAPEAYCKRLHERLDGSADAKWLARPIVLADIWKRDPDGHLISSLKYRRMAIELLGAVFENAHFGASGEARWIGLRDELTAAEEIRRVIHAFGSESSDEAGVALDDLLGRPALKHWHTDILYARANQIRTAREANFTYADVSEVVATLANAEPANVADLKALVSVALADVARDIRDGNTDGYKSFWNVDRYGRPTRKHVDENTARNRLLEHLRARLRHLDVTAEPEVRYADEKRADVAIYCRGMKLPIEIKRDDHPEIWTAAEQQLQKQYSRDPACEGNGIYLAIWFDGKDMKIHPGKSCRPKSPQDFREFLRHSIPAASAGLIEVAVIDVSVPRATRRNAARSLGVTKTKDTKQSTSRESKARRKSKNPSRSPKK